MSLETHFFALAAAYRRRTEEGGLLPVNFASDGEADEVGESADRLGSVFQRVVVIRSPVGLEDFLNGDGSEKQGRSPASKSSVESMPRVVIGGDKEAEGGCPICLEEWSEGDVAAVMPCEHKFHSKCVEEWLGMHATCPLCRYEMPVEEVEEEEKVGVWVGLSVSNGEVGGDSNPRDETEA
ncbi:RING-type domain-containing protein [Hirschfeldia incana]|nr:RING-type domain-containing protein [Hirschfeldia incana]